MPEISVIILNWNKADETLLCLDSLHLAGLNGVEVIVVDNGSEDGSAGRIRDVYRDITLIETGDNLGYAEGNNIGIRHALAKGSRFIFILNNDTRVSPGILDCLLDAARRSPQAAFFGPKILHLEAPDRVQSAGISLDYLWQSRSLGMDEQDHPGDTALLPVHCITGAAMFIRADVLPEIGLLDPNFFLYREDIDWCLRALKNGYQVLFVPGARVWHRGHLVREGDFPRITYYMTRNSLLLLNKHHGGWLRTSGLLLRFLLTLLSWSIRPKWKHKGAERAALLQGITDYYHHRFGQGPI
jgi:GT2 family glycosyltransferase